MIHVKLLTPYEIVIEKKASMLLLPAHDGEIGILPAHVSMISSLGPGLIKLYSGNTMEYQAFIFKGFANIENDGVTIMVNSYKKIEELNYNLASAEIESLTNELDKVTDNRDADIITNKINAMNKIIEICSSN